MTLNDIEDLKSRARSYYISKTGTGATTGLQWLAQSVTPPYNNGDVSQNMVYKASSTPLQDYSAPNFSIPNAPGSKRNYLVDAEIQCSTAVLGNLLIWDYIAGFSPRPPQSSYIGVELPVSSYMDLDYSQIHRTRVLKYSTVVWAFVVTFASGTSVASYNVNCTFTDGTSAVIPVNIPASTPAGRLVLIPTIGGKIIRAITAVTLTADSGTGAGSLHLVILNPIVEAKTTYYNTGERNSNLDSLTLIPVDAMLILLHTASAGSVTYTGNIKVAYA